MSFFLFEFFLSLTLFLPFLAFALLILAVSLIFHDSENSQEPCSCYVDDMLVMFEEEAPIWDVLSSFFVIFIEGSFFFELNSSSCKTGGVERRKSILFFVLAFIVHDIVVKTDRMDIDESAVFDSTNFGAFLHANWVALAFWAFHLCSSK